jgi:Ca2+-binding EF-hand superfamily protein
VPFTRTNAFFIFDHFSKNNSNLILFINSELLSIYEVICVLTITSYTTYINKIHFLEILFDLDNSGNISLNELLIIFKSVVMGYSKLTDTELPPYITLEKFAKLMFLKSDI